MTKHDKRLKKARNNPKGVSYHDFISMLDKEGYIVRIAKGSHRVATRMVNGKEFRIIFAEPHGKKKNIHEEAVKLLLKQLDEIEALVEDEDE